MIGNYRSIKESNYQVYVLYCHLPNDISSSPINIMLHRAPFTALICCFWRKLVRTSMQSSNKATSASRKPTRSFQKWCLIKCTFQNNKNIKCYGGAKHLLNKRDELGLVQFKKFEDSIDGPKSKETRKHHQDNNKFREMYLKDVQKVYDGMVANPCIRNTSLIFPDIVFHNISISEATGTSQFDTFFSA